MTIAKTFTIAMTVEFAELARDWARITFIARNATFVWLFHSKENTSVLNETWKAIVQFVESTCLPRPQP